MPPPDAHPEILGIGIDEDAALVVRGNRFEVIGAGRVAIYDNQRRDGSWYYWLKPGEQSIYQLHRNLRTTDKDNTMAGYIANCAQGNP